MMDLIIGEEERDPNSKLTNDAACPEPGRNMPDAICAALREVAGLLDIAAAVTFTIAGDTSLLAARERPAAPIVSMTPSQSIARRLALVWGVHSVRIDEVNDIDDMIAQARKTVKDEAIARNGDVIAITGGTPFGVSGTTNLLKLEIV